MTLLGRNVRSTLVFWGWGLVLASALTSPACAQTASVLDVVPEGVVIDAASLPDLQPGAKVGFHHPGDGPEVGHGSVQEVRDGRALVKLTTAGTVQAGDVAVRCASLPPPGTQDDLRTTIQGLKAQPPPSDGSSSTQQAMIAQIESVLDARDGAIRDGACDVSSYDGQLTTLIAQLQQSMAGAAPTASVSSSEITATPDAAGSPAASTAEQGAGNSPAPQDASSSSDVMSKLFQLIQGLLEKAQSPGSGSSGDQSSAGQQFSGASPASDVVSSPASPSTPPTGEQPAPQAPSPVSSLAPVTDPSPVAGPAPAPPPSPGTVSGPPPGLPPSQGTSPVATPSPPPSPGQAPPGSRPPISQRPPWWATPKPLVPTPAAPSTPTAPGDAAAPKIPSPVARLPVLRTPIALARPGTVQGQVRDEDGHPVGGALVTVGGRQAVTTVQGLFSAEGVPPGRQTLIVTARGFRAGSVTVEVDGGEVQRVRPLVLHHQAIAPPPSLNRPQGRVGPTPDHISHR